MLHPGNGMRSCRKGRSIMREMGGSGLQRQSGGEWMCAFLSRVLLGSMMVLVTTVWAVPAQQTSEPKLQSRSSDTAVAAGNADVDASGQHASTLPLDVSGAYHSKTIGKSIEIDIVRGKLSGYVSQLGDAETDSNTPLTFFFDRTSVDGDHFTFQTRVVHGVWYSFSGSISRGDGLTRADEGYYVLHGVLEIHHPDTGQDKSANETIEKLIVHLKSVAQ